MQLTLVKDGAINRLILPEKCSGQYWVTYQDATGCAVNLIGVEGLDGHWVLKANKHAFPVDASRERLREVVLEPDRFFEIQIAESGERVLLHSEPSTEDRKRFRKMLLPAHGELAIGRAPGCDILFDSKFASSRHALLNVNDADVTVADLGSSNGTFVNGRRVQESTLNPGDVISVIGLTIVIGRGFIAVNNPGGAVSFNEAVLKPLVQQRIEPTENDEIEEARATALFSRSPRLMREISTTKISIDSPPQRNDADGMPLMMVLGPALTMGLASLTMGVFGVMNAISSPGPGAWMRAAPTLIMSISMMTGMILWPILNRRYEKKNRIAREILRAEKYREYLEKMRVKIEDERTRQSEILGENVIDLTRCVQRIRTRERNLWERMNSHSDFLRLRLGVGEWPLDADIKFAERHFTLDDDDLLEEMYQIAEQPKVLRDVPVSLSLTEQPVIGVIGDRTETIALVRGLIVQLAALHSYDDLKFAFLYDPKETDIWDFVRLLPHAWADDKSVRFVATTTSEAKHLSSFLDQELAARETITNDEQLADVTPHYIVFALDRQLASKTELVDRILRQKKGRGFSLVALYDTMENLPKECRAVVKLDGVQSRVMDRTDTSGSHITFMPDEKLRDDARDLAVLLANTELDTAANAFVLPTMLTFLELFGVGKVEHLNSLTRWKDNNPVISLETPVGVDSSGEKFKLDLHEKYHGPHGLIAGMTGSGKSEFIMAYILSLAVNYHPDEVAFVLIDYKGGGMANAFTELPHVAGTITNLDGAAVNRSLISIQSELKRRQALFNLASEKTGTSNIDIYKYQSLYREGAVTEPLPHLLIISDEFAELKSQQPEFMAQLVSAARIGRSLGVHLILATQKPSGVVDDQIWSNSKFRVCLKVQERADSMEVIKRPDAAELSVTGRFYLQVGFNEFFELGQSAWAGAPYYPADRVEKAYDNSVVLVNNLGMPARQARLDRRKTQFSNPLKQLDAITAYLQRLAEEENVRARPLWLDPIPETVFVDELRAKYRYTGDKPFVLNPVIGEYDDPANQQQAIMTLPISEEGNAVIYGSAGSGKTTFVATLIGSLLGTHSAKELAVYILDFASETLRAYQDAPQVGDVILSHEAEKVNNLFRMLAAEVERRKKLVSDYGGDYRSYVNDSEESMESIVVVIHNFSAFTEMYDDKESAIAYLTREGTKYGIYFILTAASASAVRYRILQNFKQLLVLQLNDQTEYAGVLGNTGGVYPSPLKGRGIIKSDRVYEFQTAHPHSGVDNDLAWARSFSAELAASGAGGHARRIPTLPAVVDADYLRQDIADSELGSVPIGVDKLSLDSTVFDFGSSLMTLVLSQANEDPAFAQGLAEALALQYADKTLVLDADGAFVDDADRGYRLVSGADALNAEVLALFDVMVARNNSLVDARDAGEPLPQFERSIVVVPWLTGLLDLLTDEHADKFKAMIEKCDSNLGMNFVFFDAASGASKFTYENWMKSKLVANTGIFIGDGFTDQYVIQAAKSSNELYQEIGPRFGWVLSRGRTRLVKLLVSRMAEGVGEGLE